MRIAFLASDKAREQLLADAFLMGARRHGHTTEVRSLGAALEIEGYDVACFVGVKSRELVQRHHAAGCAYIMLDKGYTRHKRTGGPGWEYWRVAVNSHHPVRRVDPALVHLPADRLDALDLAIEPWRKTNKTKAVVIAGSSAKYHAFYNLPDPNGYAEALVRAGGMVTPRRWIYRPKPSWADGAPIDGAEFSALPESIDDVLDKAHVVVTHGSNACFEAVLRGVPCIVLGEGVAKPVSSTSLADLDNPLRCSDADRRQWLANVAYHQWTASEMSAGLAWDFIGTELHQ